MNWYKLIFPLRVIGVILIIVAILSLALSIGLGISTKKFVDQSVRGTATIVELRPVKSMNNNACVPVFEFRDQSGAIHRKASVFASDTFAIGESIGIIYLPNNPDDAIISRFIMIWYFSILFAILGIIPLFIGVLFIWMFPFVVNIFVNRRIN